MNALAAALGERAEKLTRRVLDEMLANPFWRERFGAAAERYGRSDGNYHVGYLAEALSARDPAILEKYARWLQSVLVSRGMCTRHLAENFARLAQAIADEALPGGELATAYLQAAERALTYPEGPARTVQLAAPAVASGVAASLYARHPEWRARWGAEGERRCADDVVYHLTYLADALAVGRAELLANYLGFIAAFLARRSIPAAHLEETLDAMAAALPAVDPGGAAVEMLARARVRPARTAGARG